MAEDTSGRLRGWLLLAGVALLAGAYFAAASPLGIDLLDAGQIVYPSWVVAEGGIPHREFRHLYSPSLFFLNGALLEWGASDMAAIRAFLVLVKVVTGVLVYVLARRVARPVFALLVWLWFVAIWGAPFPFNTPYANHYALTLGLLGLAAFLSAPTVSVGCALAGACFGVAATFKVTSGLFELMSLCFFLLAYPRAAMTPSLASVGQRIPARLAGAIGIGVVATFLALVAAYLRPRNTAWNVIALATPAVVLGVVAIRGFLAADHRARVGAVVAIACAGAGASLAPIMLLGFYAAHGLVPELADDLARELPALFRWFVPIPTPGLRTLLALLALAGSLGAVRLLASGRRNAALGAGGVALVAVGLFFGAAARETGLAGYLRGGWYLDVRDLWFLVPLAVFWSALPLVARARTERSAEPDSRADALRLLTFHAGINVLYLYPAGDHLHVMMILPSFLPLLAHVTQRFCDAGGRDATLAWRLAPAAPLAVAMGVLATPCLQAAAGVWQGGRSISLPRASNVRGVGGYVVQVLKELERREPGRTMLVTTGEQLLYFLAGRRSAVERDEFVIYLVAVELIDDDDARRLVDEDRFVERLSQARPLIVDNPRNPRSQSFRRVFPRVADYIDAHYRPTTDRGLYRILEWAG